MELALIWSKAVSRTPGGTQKCAPEGPPAPSSHPSHHPKMLVSFVLFCLFIFAALGLGCCPQTFSSCGSRGCSPVAVGGLLVGVTFLAAEHRI